VAHRSEFGVGAYIIFVGEAHREFRPVVRLAPAVRGLFDPRTFLGISVSPPAAKRDIFVSGNTAIDVWTVAGAKEPTA
jgi:hypothetical protein